MRAMRIVIGLPLWSFIATSTSTPAISAARSVLKVLRKDMDCSFHNSWGEPAAHPNLALKGATRKRRLAIRVWHRGVGQVREPTDHRGMTERRLRSRRLER